MANTGDVTFKENAAFTKRLERAFAYGFLAFGYEVERSAKRNVHVITGNLRRSIHTVCYLHGESIVKGQDENGNATPDYGSHKDVQVYVGTNTGYGAYEEFGTMRRPAHPFLTPAFHEHLGKAKAIIEKQVKKELGA